jgi:integrase
MLWKLYRRPNTAVFWARRTPDGLRRSTGETQELEALIRIREWERTDTSAPDRPAHQASYSVSNALAAFLLSCQGKVARHKLSAASLSMYTCKAAHLERVLGKTPEQCSRDEWDGVVGNETLLSRVDTASIDAYIHQRQKEGAADATIFKELVTLRGTLKLARRSKLYLDSPSDVMPEFSSGYVPRKRWLAVSDAWRLVEAFPPPQAAHLAWLLGTGARASEARRACRADFDESKRQLRIPGTKTAASVRIIPVTRLVLPFVERALRDAPGKDSGPLFAPWISMNRDIRRACKRLGFEHASPNDLRRSFCSWHVQAGIPYEQVAKLMGHTSTAMISRVYGQMPPDDLQHLIEARIGSGQQDAGLDGKQSAA